jgi:4-amino-4-deoxy-L-arabinose transferase-like glycosyltransferase
MYINLFSVRSVSSVVKKLAPVLILLLTFALNLRALSQYERFHPDEAFYMTFARNAAVNGDWWLRGALDKPPLTMYLNAAGLMLYGVDSDASGVLYLDVHKGEFAARITGVFVGMLFVAVSMALAKALYRNSQVAWLAGFLLAVSPYTSAFSATAFTDMPMLLFATCALYAATKQKSLASGIFCALAFAAKPQAVYLFPLVLLFFFTTGRVDPAHQNTKFTRRDVWMIFRWLVAFALGMALLLAWDAARGETSIFALGAANNAPEGDFWAVPEQWGERLGIWWSYAQWLFGQGWVTWGLSVLVVAMATRRVETPRYRTDKPTEGAKTHHSPFSALVGWLAECFSSRRSINVILWLWLFAYTGWHIVTRLNIYDRYLLLVLLPLALLVSYVLYALSQEIKGCFLSTFLAFSLFLCFSVLNLLVLPPIGSDRGDYTGIDELADYLNAKPIATVIYDRWLGWELGYYMGQWTDKRRVYFPTPEALARGALALDEQGTRYLVAPRNIDHAAWLAALEAANFAVRLDREIAGFLVYEVIPPA